MPQTLVSRGQRLEIRRNLLALRLRGFVLGIAVLLDFSIGHSFPPYVIVFRDSHFHRTIGSSRFLRSHGCIERFDHTRFELLRLLLWHDNRQYDAIGVLRVRLLTLHRGEKILKTAQL